MERNAWRFAHDIALRIDDARVLSHYIRAFVTEREEEAFFFQQDLDNHDYMKASESSKTHVPSYNYFAKICGCINDHYDDTWNLSKAPARLRKSSSALHVKMVGCWLHDGQNSMPFPG